MQKGIKVVSALVIFGTYFIASTQTAGQENIQVTEQPSKQLYLTKKELPMDFTIREVEKGVHKANMEVTTLSTPKPKRVEKEKVQTKSHTHSHDYKEMTVEATAYVSFCDTGCIGITATGTNVQETIYHPSGYRIIAVDPNVIPLGSIVEINGTKYIADDTGGAIKGNKIDILVSTHNTKKAFKFGRKQLTIKVLQ